MKDTPDALVSRFKDAPPPLPGRPVDLDAAKALAEWRAHPSVASGGLLTDTYVPIYLAALVGEVERLTALQGDQTGLITFMHQRDEALRERDEARAEVERLTKERSELMPSLVALRNTFWGGGGPAQRDEAGAWVLPASTEARITAALDAIRPQIDAAWLGTQA